MTEKKRRLLWSAAVIAAFIIGFLLGLKYCEMHRSGGEGGGLLKLKGGGGGAGNSPGKLGTGNGSGTANGSGYVKSPVDTDSSTGGQVANGGGGGGDAGKGGSKGNSDTPFDSGEFKKAPKPVDTLSAGFTAGLAHDLLTGAEKGKPAPPGPHDSTATADDFSLDQTALPRFPMDVTTAYSAVSTRSDKPADTGTAAVFATKDSYDSVTSWYQHHMPNGAKTIGVDQNQLAALAKQLSPKNIAKMFGMSKDSAPAPADTAAADSTPPDRRLTAWQLPDDGVHGERQVTVIDEPGKPTTVLMTRSKRP